MIFAGFIIPLFVIIFSYILIYVKLKERKSRNRHVQYRSYIYNVSQNSVQINRINQHPKVKSWLNRSRYHHSLMIANLRRKNHNHALTTIFFNLATFCLAWTPYMTMTLIAQFSHVSINKFVTPHVVSMSALFVKFSTVYNPIVYTLIDKRFQNFILKLIR